MKKISDLLKRKRVFSGPKIEIDQKAIESIFFSILGKEVKNVCRADIREIKFKDKKLFIKTTHPLSANEVWRNRRKITTAINEVAAKEIVSDLSVK